MRLPAFVWFALLLCALPASAQSLKKLETADLRLLFRDPAQTFLSRYAARCFENSMSFQRRLFNYSPSQKVTVLLNDYSDGGNASTMSTPRNLMLLETAPIDFAFETVTPNERLNWLMNHELVHVAAVDQAARSDRRFRAVFGGKVFPDPEDPESIFYFYLTSPRDAAPRWYHEGIAVFLETWMAGGLGRAQGAYDEMVFRSMALDGSRFYDPLGLVSEGTKIDFQVEVNSYLYGTRFMSYLAFRYSPEAVVRWVSRTDGSRRYYASQFRQVFGRDLNALWREWIEWEKEFQRKNLESIRQSPVTPYKDLSREALGSISRAFYDPETRRIYAAFNYPGVVAHIGAISTDRGTVERIVEVKDPVLYTVTSVAYDPGSRTIFYTTDNHEFRDLRAVKPATGQSRTLLKDARIGDLAFDRADGSLWGIRHFNGIATLVRVPPTHDVWRQVHSWPYGEVAYDIDVSPDGQLLSASIAGVDGRHSVQVFRTEELLAGKAETAGRFDFGDALPLNFVFSPDGKYLYGSSYFTGVSNIYRYGIETGKAEALTNSETGFFRPIPLADGSLIVFRYTGEGFVPAVIQASPTDRLGTITFLGAQLVEKFPQLKGWMIGPPGGVPIDTMITGEGEYRMSALRLESVYPVILGYKNSVAGGYRINLSDYLGLNRLNFTTAYSPDRSLPSGERLHAMFEFRRYDWKASAAYNGADFYDLFGPTKTGFKGYALELGYNRALIYDQPKKLLLSLEGAYFGNLERLPDYQNVQVGFSRFLRTRAKLEYSNLRSSLGHVDDEKGTRWEVVAQDNLVNGTSIPMIHADHDFGAALPLRHSSLWVRSSAGAAFGNREDPFASFYFGGFGNNWVDHGPEKRYREFYSFPGKAINDVGGRNYAKTMVEWNLPPLRFRRAGTPGFYASWARTSLFCGGIATNLDDADFRRKVWDLGTQVDVRFSLLSRLDMTLSLGYGAAFEKGRRRDEFMLSVKILN